MKKGSQLYKYLEQTGVLTNGSPDEIANAKKKYWSEVRREWKRQKRQECKSYTVFFTKSEFKQITGVVKNSPGGVTAFIKQAALTQATGRVNIDKHFIGLLRQELALYYGFIQGLAEHYKISPVVSELILKQIVQIENKVFGYLSK